jgi:hypothetical protein
MIMKIEDIKIEDAADANYVIKKFFNNDLSKITMAQLEQLVLTVYSMGKNGAPADSASGGVEPESADKVPEKVNPFKMGDNARVLEEFEIGHSGEFIKTDDVGRVTLVKGDNITVLYEAGEEGEMIEITVSYDKLEKLE